MLGHQFGSAFAVLNLGNLAQIIIQAESQPSFAVRGSGFKPSEVQDLSA